MNATNDQFIATDERFAAHNYHPLPVVAAHAEGSWITDVEGNRYLDLLSAYSALNFGHRHPRLVEAARRQLDTITLTSRAIHNDQMGALCEALAGLCSMDSALLMNTGAEAVETALKLARKWGYVRKGVTPGRANIVVADGNFHGRTISIISFSSDDDSKDDFGPFTPGFRSVPYGDATAIAEAIDDDTVAVLIEPIQGEAGVIIPPAGYLSEVRDICTNHNVLFIADEIQSGLGRTGRTFACDHEAVHPDVYVIGKALGGGIVPLSAVVTHGRVMDVIRPGQHGSTFGGNPLAASVGREVVAMLEDGSLSRRADELGVHLSARLSALDPNRVETVRVRGLWAAIDLDPTFMSGRQFAERMLERKVIVKDTHGSTVRIAPPLTIDRHDLDWGLDQFEAVLASEAVAVTT